MRKSPAKVIPLRSASTKRGQAYRFVDRDPIIETLITIMDDSGLSDAMIAAKAMCSWQTVNNIRVKTKRPQNYTIDRVLRACGFKRTIVRI